MCDIQYERCFSSIIYLYTLSIIYLFNYHLVLYPSIYLPSVCIYHLSTYLSIIDLSINHLSTHPLSIYLPIYSSIIYLSVYPSFLSLTTEYRPEPPRCEYWELGAGRLEAQLRWGPSESLALLSPLPSPSQLPCLSVPCLCELLPLHSECHWPCA